MESVAVAAAVPVPLRLTVCGLEVSPSVMVKVPVRLATEPGVKVTLMIQLAPALRLVPQVLVSAKLLLAAMLVMVSAVVPMLLRVTVCAGLVVLICWFPKLKLPVDRRTEVTGTTSDTVTV